MDFSFVKAFSVPIFDLVQTYWTQRNIFLGVIFMTWIIYLWEIYLGLRQHFVAQAATSVPPELAGVMDKETFSKARYYHLDKSKFSFISKTWDQILMTTVLLYQGIPWLWEYSGILLHSLGYQGEHEILQTTIFCFLGSVICTLLDLPWSIYYTFVLEEKHGFNKQTAGFFVKDKIKKFVVGEFLLLPITCCLVQIVLIGGPYFFIYLWVFCCVVMLILMTIYPDYIAPLFDNFTPLKDGPLKEEIEKMAASIDFPLKKVYIVEGSKRSAHSNAYFYGFHKNKRIVLFDTLLENYTTQKEQDAKKSEDANEDHLKKADEVDAKGDSASKVVGCNDDEVLAVLGHELGHWKLNHILKNILIAQINLFFSFLVFSLLFQNKTLYAAFGFQTQPIIVGLILIFQFIFSPYNELLSFLMNILSRSFEFDADRFAKKMNRAADLRSALIKLNKDNLGFPIYDALYSAWHHSHPPLLERIQAIGKLD